MAAPSREAILARARSWAEAARPYSQELNDPASGYRMDCSGYLSMTWGLPAPGLDTVRLPDVAERIEWSELTPGDAVMKAGPGTEGDNGHAILFAGWADTACDRMWVFEQVEPHTVHRAIVVPQSPPFQPYRLRTLPG
jgi:hypothetical protein